MYYQFMINKNIIRSLKKKELIAIGATSAGIQFNNSQTTWRIRYDEMPFCVLIKIHLG